MSPSADQQDLRQLRIQAKELVRSVRTGDQNALARCASYFPTAPQFVLANAQLVIARENGYDSWSQLKHVLEGSGDASQPSRGDLLFAAIEEGDDETATELIADGPDLAGVWRRKDHGWENALSAAARKGRLGVAQALVEAGASVYTVNQGDYPPVFRAVRGGHREVADYLLEVSASTDGGLPPTFGCGIDIVLASRLGMLDRVRMHVQRDPMAVFRRGCIGESVLHWPSHDGHVEVVRFLLDSGAMLAADEIGLYGGKPIHWAAEHSPGTLELLLTRGADPNSRNVMHNDFEGYTPLHMWARQREEVIECGQLLIEAGADPSLKDVGGRTALDVAIEKGRDQCRSFLERLVT